MTLKSLPGLMKRLPQLTGLAAKGVAGLDRLCKLGLELCLAFRLLCRRRRHGRRVLLFRLAQGCFGLREALLDVGARRVFVTDQPIEFDLTFSSLGIGGEMVSEGAASGGLCRARRVGQLPFEGAPPRCG